MASKLGLEAKLFRNTGTYATPVWNEITNVKDLTLTLEKGEADTSTRAAAGWKTSRGTLKEATVEFDMVWDTLDDDFAAIRDSFLNGTLVDLAVLDGGSAVVGSQGFRSPCEVLKFTRNEQLTEAITVSVTLKPTYSANPPVWMTVA
jgi:hypothetical protein